RHAPEHALAQTLHDIAAFHDRAHGEPVGRTAVLLRNHEVLRDVDQTASQVSGVGGLQSGVGETLTGAVRRDEVLHGVQAFAEVGRNRRLDDRAVRFSHQAAHARKLTNLRRRTAGARVGHHVDGIERLLRDYGAARVDRFFHAELVHHRLGDLVIGARPDVDDLVVALAVGDETGRVLFLDLLHLALGAAQDLALLLRHDHVVHTDGD